MILQSYISSTHPPPSLPLFFFLFFFSALHSPSCEEIEMAVLCTWITLSIECFVQNFSCTVAKQNRALCFCSLKLFMVLNVCFKIVLFVLGWPSMVDRVIESKQPKTNSFHYEKLKVHPEQGEILHEKLFSCIYMNACISHGPRQYVHLVVLNHLPKAVCQFVSTEPSFIDIMAIVCIEPLFTLP